MNWIKKFEELDYSTYRSAANKLQYWNKSNRAGEILDHADERKYGVYGMHVSHVNNSILSKNGAFTKPTLIGFYFGISYENSLHKIGDSNLIEDLVEDLIKNWSEGKSTLSIKLEFGFKPMSRNKFKFVPIWKDKQRYLDSLPMFSMDLNMSCFDDGLESWNEDTHEATTTEMFADNKDFKLYLETPMDDKHFGIFSDRKSAMNFKKYFTNLVNEEKWIFNIISDIIRYLNGEPEDLLEIKDVLNNIRYSGLYDDEIDRSSESIKKRWFGSTGKMLNF
jgi:hypothetical protein